MSAKQYTPEQIVRLLREAEFLQSQGLTVPKTCRQLGFSEHTYYRWRRTYDFVFDRTTDGRPLKLLTLLDEYTRECLALEVSRHFTNEELQRVLGRLFVHRGIPRYVRSDNGPEFTATAGTGSGGAGTIS
ncbi:DDE-type integrase/transposase/recombinase, partial [bacterium]|nr:DDE-type integrase/transposase/recombinase [bacterium]